MTREEYEAFDNAMKYPNKEAIILRDNFLNDIETVMLSDGTLIIKSKEEILV